MPTLFPSWTPVVARERASTGPQAMRSNPKLPVLFIAGAGRSGSTLLERVLGQVKGAFAAGELYWIWSRAWRSMICECGQPSQECEFWRAVLFEALGPKHEAVRTQVGRLSSRVLRHRFAPLIAVSRRRAEYMEISTRVAALYRGIRAVSGASTVVDSTKSGYWGLVISAAGEVDLRVVHLVRDPRAYAYSWTRPRGLPHLPSSTMSVRSTTRSLAMWLMLNTEAELLKCRLSQKTVLLLYEDFVGDPVTLTTRIVAFAGLDSAGVPALFAGRTLINDGAGHAIAGNPMRAARGPLHIAPDDEWRSGTSRGARLLASVFAEPLWHHYQASNRGIGREAPT